MKNLSFADERKSVLFSRFLSMRKLGTVTRLTSGHDVTCFAFRGTKTRRVSPTCAITHGATWLTYKIYRLYVQRSPRNRKTQGSNVSRSPSRVTRRVGSTYLPTGVPEGLPPDSCAAPARRDSREDASTSPRRSPAYAIKALDRICRFVFYCVRVPYVLPSCSETNANLGINGCIQQKM